MEIKQMNTDEQEAKKGKGVQIFYLIFALVLNLGIFFILHAEDEYSYDPMFGDYTFGVVLTCWPISYFFMLIANFLRKALMPDMIFTNEGFTGLLKAQVFWLIGPQFFAGIIPPIIAVMMYAKY